MVPNDKQFESNDPIQDSCYSDDARVKKKKNKLKHSEDFTVKTISGHIKQNMKVKRITNEIKYNLEMTSEHIGEIPAYSPRAKLNERYSKKLRFEENENECARGLDITELSLKSKVGECEQFKRPRQSKLDCRISKEDRNMSLENNESLRNTSVLPMNNILSEKLEPRKKKKSKLHSIGMVELQDVSNQNFANKNFENKKKRKSKLLSISTAELQDVSNQNIPQEDLEPKKKKKKSKLHSIGIQELHDVSNQNIPNEDLEPKKKKKKSKLHSISTAELQDLSNQNTPNEDLEPKKKKKSKLHSIGIQELHDASNQNTPNEDFEPRKKSRSNADSINIGNHRDLSEENCRRIISNVPNSENIFSIPSTIGHTEINDAMHLNHTTFAPNTPDINPDNVDKESLHTYKRLTDIDATDIEVHKLADDNSVNAKYLKSHLASSINISHEDSPSRKRKLPLDPLETASKHSKKSKSIVGINSDKSKVVNVRKPRKTIISNEMNKNPKNKEHRFEDLLSKRTNVGCNIATLGRSNSVVSSDSSMDEEETNPELKISQLDRSNYEGSTRMRSASSISDLSDISERSNENCKEIKRVSITKRSNAGNIIKNRIEKKTMKQKASAPVSLNNVQNPITDIDSIDYAVQIPVSDTLLNVEEAKSNETSALDISCDDEATGSSNVAPFGKISILKNSKRSNLVNEKRSCIEKKTRTKKSLTPASSLNNKDNVDGVVKKVRFVVDEIGMTEEPVNEIKHLETADSNSTESNMLENCNTISKETDQSVGIDNISEMSSNEKKKKKVKPLDSQCQHCESSFATPYGLAQHVRQSHKDLWQAHKEEIIQIKKEKSILWTVEEKQKMANFEISWILTYGIRPNGAVIEYEIGRSARSVNRIKKHDKVYKEIFEQKMTEHKISDSMIDKSKSVLQCSKCDVEYCLKYQIDLYHHVRLGQCTTSSEKNNENYKSLTDDDDDFQSNTEGDSAKFGCKYCESKFIYKVRLVHHMRKKHRDQYIVDEETRPKKKYKKFRHWTAEEKENMAKLEAKLILERGLKPSGERLQYFLKKKIHRLRDIRKTNKEYQNLLKKYLPNEKKYEFAKITKKGLYVCPLCHRNFKAYYGYRKHVDVQHDGKVIGPGKITIDEPSNSSLD